jgi:multisubunit Na+/H+ antiporter MnhE subunit
MFGNDMTCSGIANIDNDITCTLLANKITVTNGFKSADHNGSEITIEFTHFTNPHSLN